MNFFFKTPPEIHKLSQSSKRGNINNNGPNYEISPRRYEVEKFAKKTLTITIRRRSKDQPSKEVTVEGTIIGWKIDLGIYTKRTLMCEKHINKTAKEAQNDHRTDSTMKQTTSENQKKDLWSTNKTAEQSNQIRPSANTHYNKLERI